MAEVPYGYCPDVFPGAEPTITPTDNSFVEKSVSRNMREVRRSWGPAAGLRRWAWPTSALDQTARYRVRQFLKNRQGEFDAFYLWTPDTAIFEDVAAGTVTAASRFIIPLRTTNAAGGAVGNITDVRVAGVTKAFTSRYLIPRPTMYAALRLVDSSSQYISCGNSSTLKPAGDHTFSAWVYRVSSGAEQVICSNFIQSASGSALRVSAAGFPIFYTAFPSSYAFATCNTAVPNETWTLVTVTKTSGSVIFFINGVQKNTVSITNQTTATGPFYVGQDGASALYWNGMLSGVRMYDVAVSAAEVAKIYSDTATASANLRGWWRITEGYGSTATDLSGYGNNGTLQGSPTWMSGEEEISFTGGAQTGPVTVWGLLRERVVVRYDGASRRQRFVGATPLTSIDLAFQELY